MFCCEMMRDQLTHTCKDHDKYECPDALIHRWENGTTGIHVKDGGSSLIVINFCPWCAADLRVSTWAVEALVQPDRQQDGEPEQHDHAH